MKKTVQNLGKKLKQLESIKDPKELETAKAEILNNLLGEVGEAIGRALLKAEYASKGTGYKVLANIEAVREVPGYKSIAEWKAAQIKAGKNVEPGDLGKFREAQGKLWESLGEADGLVVKETATGKLLPVEAEQVKTGVRDKPSEATAQNTKFINTLKDIAGGKKDVKLFEKIDKAKVGADRTGDFDLSDLSSVKQSTRGLPDKGFDKKLPEARNVLEELAKSIIESGLPTTANPLPLPPPSPKNQ